MPTAVALQLGRAVFHLVEPLPRPSRSQRCEEAG